jgi:HK97 family phage major capsid protein
MINLKSIYDTVNKAEAEKTAKAIEIQKLFDAGETEKGLAMKPELDALTKKAKEANEMYLSMRGASEGDENGKKFTPAKSEELIVNTDILKSHEYTTAFFKAMSNGVTIKEIKKNGVPEGMEVLMKALTETGGSPAGADGGFLLPTDFNNMIIERSRQFTDLSSFVNVETVHAYSGWRSIETTAAALPFALMTVDGSTAVPTSEQPAFTKIDYSVKDYGGILPVSNDLLNDTPVNIMTYLSGFFGKKLTLTNNSLILPILKAISATDITKANQNLVLDGIKTALNLTLDPAISVNSSIIVNQTGFNVLDQIKDGYGRPLLQPDPTNATTYFIFGRPVIKLADRLMANYIPAGGDGKNRSPVYIGDGKSFITMFSRSGLEMASTNIGGNSWANNNTEVRCITRKDTKKIDGDAACSLAIILDA